MAVHTARFVQTVITHQSDNAYLGRTRDSKVHASPLSPIGQRTEKRRAGLGMSKKDVVDAMNKLLDTGHHVSERDYTDFVHGKRRLLKPQTHALSAVLMVDWSDLAHPAERKVPAKRTDNPRYMDVCRPEKKDVRRAAKGETSKVATPESYDRLEAQRRLEKKFGKGHVSFGTK